MAPRRRTVGPSAWAQAASLASLPDGLLERILRLLEQRDRHRAALVSRRWHAVAHAPATLQKVKLFTAGPRVMTQLPSFTAWLARHGRHVRSLNIDCYPPSDQLTMVAWELAGCLTACAATAAGSLQRLSLRLAGGGTLCVASWCAALRQLRSLELEAISYTLRIGSSLAGLTALTQLSLSGQRVSVDAAAQLPPAVERLRLRDRASTALPSQLSALTRITMLVLSAESCQPGGFAVLSSLGRLACLVLKGNSHLPACLPQLTGLEELCLDEACSGLNSDEAAAAVKEALQQLTGVNLWMGWCCSSWAAGGLHCCIIACLACSAAQCSHTFSCPCCQQLTSLCIIDEPERCQPPAALAGLSRLQRCCLGSAEYDPVELPGQPTRLPRGPWAASLRELGASLDVLACSTRLLSAATQLTRLAITGGSYEHSDALWKWARSHPPLRQLQVDMREDAKLPGSTVHAICSLAHERPELTVVTVLYEEGSTFDDEFGIELIC